MAAAEWRIAKCRLDTPTKDLSEAYYGFAVFVPTGFVTSPGGRWVNIGELQEIGAGWRMFCGLSLYGPSRPPTLHLRTDWNGVGESLWTDSAPITRVWHTFVIYLKTGPSGRIILWKDGVQVFDMARNHSSTSSYVGPAFDAGIYQGSDCAAQYVVIDEMRVASTYEFAVPSLPSNDK